jgi:hypothetical protein
VGQDQADIGLLHPGGRSLSGADFHLESGDGKCDAFDLVDDRVATADHQAANRAFKH